ncbi:MAG: ergothioneine biosynthesis protein EgtB [Microbacteriaceae bacterium]|nr:ergothioneine biosynthesis protein EgtB [Burkholderiaceae bacterium]
MNTSSIPAAALLARQSPPQTLAAALSSARDDTLATFARFEQALPGLRVPLHAELNPPLWELGHIGWFQAWWLARFANWRQGWRADPAAPRRPDRRADADALYDSSRVPHDRRWTLPLPDADATRASLRAQLQDTLALLAEVVELAPVAPVAEAAEAARRVAGDPAPDDWLYFFRLVLLHEDMHHEAALYTAQRLGVAVADARWQARALPPPPPPLGFEPGPWRLGSEAAAGAGFAFDNELGAHDVRLGACQIDAQAVRWAEFLPFAEAGAYGQDRWWTEAGQRWRQTSGASAPRYLRQGGGGWQQWRHGQWQALPMDQAACHLSLFEAEAWCRWAGRRLPTEAEWERAACSRPAEFRWGDVWEWTASPFAPYPGFRPHPYVDYSAPWFDGRPVLRGASSMTQPRMCHPRYRNFFAAQRSDVPAGFRSCAL